MKTALFLGTALLLLVYLGLMAEGWTDGRWFLPLLVVLLVVGAWVWFTDSEPNEP